jgi:SAM-dependent methyltransferase
MNLSDLINRQTPPIPWAEGEKIPWNDPAFSARMLHEHLSQEHNAASRRLAIIDEHVSWIHSEILRRRPVKVVDLCCGPGLYTGRLAELGHQCLGIDYAPASIAYARQKAEEGQLDCRYIEADVRDASFASGNGLVMMVHGELNVFRAEETRTILNKARDSLVEGGRIVLEVHALEAVIRIGEQTPKWSSAEHGLFSDRPHILLKEAYWDESLRTATERTYIIDSESGRVRRHAASIQAYDDNAYRQLLASCRFDEVKAVPSLGGVEGVKDKNYVVYIARAA